MLDGMRLKAKNEQERVAAKQAKATAREAAQAAKLMAKAAKGPARATGYGLYCQEQYKPVMDKAAENGPTPELAAMNQLLAAAWKQVTCLARPAHSPPAASAPPVRLWTPFCMQLDGKGKGVYTKRATAQNTQNGIGPRPQRKKGEEDENWQPNANPGSNPSPSQATLTLALAPTLTLTLTLTLTPNKAPSMPVPSSKMQVMAAIPSR